MRTIFIYDQCCQDDVKFFILDGDYSHLDGIYINAVYDNDNDNEKEQKQDELNALLFDNEGQLKQSLIDSFPVAEINKMDKVITVGFYP